MFPNFTWKKHFCSWKWWGTEGAGLPYPFFLYDPVGAQLALCLCSHELRQNETQNGMDFISVILTEMKFQTNMRFSCEHNLPKKKLNKHRLVEYCSISQ